MAAVSLSIARGAAEADVAASGTQSVTVGALAPNAGDVEIRFSSAGLAAGLTSREIKELIEVLWRYAIDGKVQGGSAVLPGL
jgi:hypothetical protein